MPRKPKFIHPLRELRTVIGLTQSGLATRLGVQEITIRRIENGAGLQISQELANRLMVATGILPESLTDGRGTLKDLNHDDYTRTSWEEWCAEHTTRRLGETVISDGMRDLMAKAQLQFRVLERAAANKNRALAVLHRFEQWREKVIAELNLEPELQNVYKHKGITRTAQLPIFYKSAQGVRYLLGTRRAVTMKKKELSPALKKVAAAFKQQLSTAGSSGRRRQAQ